MKRFVLSSALPLVAFLSIALLSIVSFVFAIVSLTSADWATQAKYDIDVFNRSIATRVHTTTVRRGPLRQCVSQSNASDPDAPWSTDCDSGNGCQSSDLAWWCQQQRAGSRLLIAGCVFAGVACVYALTALAALAATVPLPPLPSLGAADEEERGRRREEKPGRRRRASPWRRYPDEREQRQAFFALARGGLCSLLALSVVLFGGGTLWLFDLLVNNQPPDGDFVTSTALNLTADHWLMGKGIVYANLGWLPNLLALLVMPSVAVAFVESRRGARKWCRGN